MPSFIWDAIASTYRDLQGGSTPGGPGTDPESTEAPQFGSGQRVMILLVLDLALRRIERLGGP